MEALSYGESCIAPISVDIPVAVTTPMHAPLEIVVEAKSMFTCQGQRTRMHVLNSSGVLC